MRESTRFSILSLNVITKRSKISPYTLSDLKKINLSHFFTNSLQLSRPVAMILITLCTYLCSYWGMLVGVVTLICAADFFLLTVPKEYANVKRNHLLQEIHTVLDSMLGVLVQNSNIELALEVGARSLAAGELNTTLERAARDIQFGIPFAEATEDVKRFCPEIRYCFDVLELADRSGTLHTSLHYITQRLEELDSFLTRAHNHTLLIRKIFTAIAILVCILVFLYRDLFYHALVASQVLPDLIFQIGVSIIITSISLYRRFFANVWHD